MIVTKSAIALRCRRTRTNQGLLAGRITNPGLVAGAPKMRMRVSATNFELHYPLRSGNPLSLDSDTLNNSNWSGYHLLSTVRLKVLHSFNFRECLVDGEIDTYFSLMDTDFDENLSYREIESGYAILRYFIFNLQVFIDDLTNSLSSQD